MTSGPAVWHIVFSCMLGVLRRRCPVRVAGVEGLNRVLLHGAAYQEMFFDRRELEALAILVNTVHGRTRCTQLHVATVTHERRQHS